MSDSFIYNGQTNTYSYGATGCDSTIFVYNGISYTFTYGATTGCDAIMFVYNGQTNTFAYEDPICINCLKWSDHALWNTHQTWGCNS